VEKYQIKVNNTTFNCDHISFEYSQQDGESSGRSEDGTMTRDVIGLINKIYCGFDYKQGSELTNLLNVAKHITSANVTYVDPSDGEVTKNMYVTCDKIEVLLINGVYVANPFEMRFIQMSCDEV
jgi:hypothetical protein